MAGIECEFVKKPPKAVQYECPICLLVLREPCQATCCGKSFCKKCIEIVKDKNSSCPTCKTENFFSYPNKGLEQSLYDFEVYCSHKSKGCEWRGELRELEKHLNSEPPADKSLEGCPFTVIKCPLGCAGCEKGVCRRDIRIHISSKLLGHLVVQNHQIKKILQRVVQLEAKYDELAKQNRDLREKMGTKQFSAMSIRSLPAEPDTHLTGTVKPVGADFTMTRFEEYKRDDDYWYSPHFYTHPQGYKMCLKINANRDSVGQSTHLSVRVCFMKGEFDDQLKWPFQGEVIIQLLSQIDEDHCVKVIPLRKGFLSAARVLETERNMYARGIGDFLPHSQLKPKYLKDDCIKLRVKKIELS